MGGDSSGGGSSGGGSSDSGFGPTSPGSDTGIGSLSGRTEGPSQAGSGSGSSFDSGGDTRGNIDQKAIINVPNLSIAEGGTDAVPDIITGDALYGAGKIPDLDRTPTKGQRVIGSIAGFTTGILATAATKNPKAGLLAGQGVSRSLPQTLANTRHLYEPTGMPTVDADIRADAAREVSTYNVGSGSSNNRPKPVSLTRPTLPSISKPIISTTDTTDTTELIEPDVFNRKSTFLAGNLLTKAPVRRRTLL